MRGWISRMQSRYQHAGRGGTRGAHRSVMRKWPGSRAGAGGRMDTLRGITVFVRVAEAKSFAAAARALLVDPTAVSRTINALEEDLGVSLFVRSTRSVKLTDEGATFYRDCLRVLADLDRARSQVRAAGTTPHGRLKIGMAPGLTRRLFVRALPAFQQRYPELEIILQ